MRFTGLFILMSGIWACKQAPERATRVLPKEHIRNLIEERDDTIRALIERIPYWPTDTYVDSFEILSIDSIAGNWNIDRDIRILERSIKHLKDTLSHNKVGYILKRAKANLGKSQQELAHLKTEREKNNDTSFYGYIVTTRFFMTYTEGGGNGIDTSSVAITKAMKEARVLTSFNDMVRNKVWQY